jgi:hypothetical protein
MQFNLKLGCWHPVACTRSGSGFLSNATLFQELFTISLNKIQYIYIYIFFFHYFHLKMFVRPKHIAVIE